MPTDPGIDAITMAIAAKARIEVVLRGVELVGGPRHLKPSASGWNDKVEGRLHRAPGAQPVTFIEHYDDPVVFDDGPPARGRRHRHRHRPIRDERPARTHRRTLDR